MAGKQLRAFLEEEWQLEIPLSFIDCVFLLLIFFLLTGRFRSLERVLATDLAGYYDKTYPPPHDTEIRVRLSWRDGVGRLVSSRAAAGPDGYVAIDANHIACRNLNELAEKLASAASRDTSLSVVIDARRHVPFRYVLGAVDACARAEIDDVRFQAPPTHTGGDDWWYQ